MFGGSLNLWCKCMRQLFIANNTFVYSLVGMSVGVLLWVDS